jgi:hypothetical protein
VYWEVQGEVVIAPGCAACRVRADYLCHTAPLTASLLCDLGRWHGFVLLTGCVRRVVAGWRINSNAYSIQPEPQVFAAAGKIVENVVVPEACRRHLLEHPSTC